MTKIKEFFKVKSNIAISAISLLAIVAIASVAVFMITKKPPTKDNIIPTVAQNSSEETSSSPTVTIPEIVSPSSTAPVSSKQTLELKVDGNPSSKVTESKPVEKPKSSSSKPASKPPVSKPNKPTPPTTATSPKDGDTKLENGGWYTYWKADGQWHYDAPEEGGETVLDDGKDGVCPICGGIVNRNENNCTCVIGNMG